MGTRQLNMCVCVCFFVPSVQVKRAVRLNCGLAVYSRLESPSALDSMSELDGYYGNRVNPASTVSTGSMHVYSPIKKGEEKKKECVNGAIGSDQ